MNGSLEACRGLHRLWIPLCASALVFGLSSKVPGPESQALSELQTLKTAFGAFLELSDEELIQTIEAERIRTFHTEWSFGWLDDARDAGISVAGSIEDAQLDRFNLERASLLRRLLRRERLWEIVEALEDGWYEQRILLPDYDTTSDALDQLNEIVYGADVDWSTVLLELAIFREHVDASFDSDPEQLKTIRQAVATLMPIRDAPLTYRVPISPVVAHVPFGFIDEESLAQVSGAGGANWLPQTRGLWSELAHKTLEEAIARAEALGAERTLKEIEVFGLSLSGDVLYLGFPLVALFLALFFYWHLTNVERAPNEWRGFAWVAASDDKLGRILTWLTIPGIALLGFLAMATDLRKATDKTWLIVAACFLLFGAFLLSCVIAWRLEAAKKKLRRAAGS